MIMIKESRGRAPVRGAEADRGRGPDGGSVRVPNISREIRASIGRERAELEAAFRLLATNYRARGYEAPGTKPCRFTRYHALPGTATFIARHDRRVVATLSLVPDTELLGLPMESIYGPEVDRLRRQGRRLAEFTSLAVQGLSLREFIQVFNTLIKLAMQYHLRQGGDTWVMTVHPRHRGYYRKVLGFSPLGTLRPHPAVQGHPAEACVLDPEQMRGSAPAMYREALGDPLPEPVLAAEAWSADRVRYFGRRSTAVDPMTIETILGLVERHGSAARWAGGEPVRPTRWPVGPSLAG
jgi:hypothetical protein